MAGKGKAAVGGAVAGGATGIVANQAAKFISGNGASAEQETGESGVVKVGPGLDRGIVEQILDFLMMDVLVGVPLIVFILLGAIIAAALFDNS